jgi:putative hemolysin
MLSAIPGTGNTSSMIPSITEPLFDLGDLRAGNMEVFVASKQADIEASQKLRYRVFVEEMGAKATPEMAAQKRDFDQYDGVCDHLLVAEHDNKGGYQIVGTYRLLRHENMEKVGRFYSEGEYDISAIKRSGGRILEVGRSCVHPEFRSRAVMQLLWRGIGAYVRKFNIDLMFGCASFHGIDPQQHAMALSYLHHYHLAPEELRPRALPALYNEMDLMPKDAVDVKAAFSALPALIKGYLRLSGYIGSGAVIDEQYNTTDVSIVVKTDLVTEKYAARYQPGQEYKRSEE